MLRFIGFLIGLTVLMGACRKDSNSDQMEIPAQVPSEDAEEIEPEEVGSNDDAVEQQEPVNVIQAPPSYCEGCDYAPVTIEQVVEIIESLPKPTTLEYFISSITPEAKIQTSTSSFSAQPAKSSQIPRVFLQINEVLLLSVVPGDDTLEIGQTVEYGFSKKADIKFPIEEGQEVNPYEIVFGPGASSENSCGRVCHRQKRDGQGNPVPFVSTILQPRAFENLRNGQLYQIAQTCVDESKTCLMFRSLFYRGPRSPFKFSED